MITNNTLLTLVALVALGLVGLFLASGAEGARVYWMGLGLTIVAVVAAFVLIRRTIGGGHVQNVAPNTSEDRGDVRDV